MRPLRQLDEWDYKIIKAFKSMKSGVRDVIRIWAERCGMDVEYAHVSDINIYLLELAQELGLFDEGRRTLTTFVYELQPSDNWKFVCTRRDYLDKSTTNFDLILLSRLDSLFSLTEVVRLPGYKEWIDKNGKD